MSEPMQDVIDLVFGRWRSQILHAGVRLGIFDACAGGERKASDVARELKLDPAMTYRLMRALASIGLLAERADRSFSLTESGQFLRRDHPATLRGMTLLEEGPEHYAIWTHLVDMIRDGKQDGFRREFKRSIFEHVTDAPAYRAVFNEAMTGYSSNETPQVLDALSTYDFAPIAHVCDIAGGHGHLLSSLLAKHRHLRGTVYDLPTTIAQKDALWADKMKVGDRCRYVAGNMFEKVPAADAYFMKHILHDWNDAECIQILDNARAASSAGARLFVVEFVVPGAETPHFSKLFDVHMICATSGQERTEGEYAALFEKSGWQLARTWLPSAGLIGVVEARRR